MLLIMPKYFKYKGLCLYVIQKWFCNTYSNLEKYIDNILGSNYA